ncbi:MAG: hypothetical protein ABJF01_25485 [bacterium]
MSATMIILRLLHILSGVFWGGALFFMARFLIPGVQASGPAGPTLMQQIIVVRKFPQVVGAAATLAILSGIGMYWRDNSISGGSFARSRSGMMYGAGALFALITYGVAIAMVAPTGDKITKLGAAIQASGGPPSPAQATEMGRLQGKIAFGTRLGATLMALAVAGMAIARYV